MSALTVSAMIAANRKAAPKKAAQAEGEGIAVKAAMALGAVVPSVRAWTDIVAESYRYHENVRTGRFSS